MHLNGHHHIHCAWGLIGLVVKFAKVNDIHSVRQYFNVQPARTVLHYSYSVLVNARFRHAGLSKARYFTSPKYVESAIHRKLSPLEVMVHPRLGPQNTIIQYPEGTDLSDIVNGFAPFYELRSHSDLLF